LKRGASPSPTPSTPIVDVTPDLPAGHASNVVLTFSEPQTAADIALHLRATCDASPHGPAVIDCFMAIVNGNLRLQSNDSVYYGATLSSDGLTLTFSDATHGNGPLISDFNWLVNPSLVVVTSPGLPVGQGSSDINLTVSKSDGTIWTDEELASLVIRISGYDRTASVGSTIVWNVDGVKVVECEHGGGSTSQVLVVQPVYSEPFTIDQITLPSGS